MDWIGVKDKLPEEGVVVLALDGTDPGIHHLATYEPDRERSAWSNDEGMSLDVTFWMPLPPPPAREDR